MISIPRATDLLLNDDGVRQLLAVVGDFCDPCLYGYMGEFYAKNLSLLLRRTIAANPAFRRHIVKLRRIARLAVRLLMPNHHRIAFLELERLKECIAEIEWILHPYSG